MTPHKKRKAADRKKTFKTLVNVRQFDASAREAFNTPAKCGECGADVRLDFRPEDALDAPNGFMIPGFGECACGRGVMAFFGPQQPDWFAAFLAKDMDDFDREKSSQPIH